MEQENRDYEILDQNDGNYDLSFKIIIIGESGVGKSCLALKGIKNVFQAEYAPTIGFEFMAFNIKIDNVIIKMQVWDTCGQEVYRSLISSFYNNSSLAIMVYSIDNFNSFHSLEYWIDEIKAKANPDINFFLIGNKCDLEENRQVSREQGQEFSDNNNVRLFLETSAKTGLNAQNVFVEASKLLYEQHLKYKNRVSQPDSFRDIINRDSNNNSPLDDVNYQRKKKHGCC